MVLPRSYGQYLHCFMDLLRCVPCAPAQEAALPQGAVLSPPKGSRVSKVAVCTYFAFLYDLHGASSLHAKAGR